MRSVVGSGGQNGPLNRNPFVRKPRELKLGRAKRLVNDRAVRTQTLLLVYAALSLCCVWFGLGCNRLGNKPAAGAPAPGAGAPGSGAALPAPEVDVVQPTEQRIIDYREYTGRTAAVDFAEIRSRVSGYIIETPRTKKSAETSKVVAVGEGERVQKDDVLFYVDPEPYQLALDEAEASLKASQATLTRFEADLKRHAI